MNELVKVFSNEQFGDVRIIVIEGEPWFAGIDVTKALGYKDSKKAISAHVDDEDKRLILRGQLAPIENCIPKDVLPITFVHAIPNRGLTFVNESGLYALVFGSQLSSAKEFKHWITRDILPSIRKHGVFMTDKALEDPEAALQNYLIATKEKIQKQADEIARLQEKLDSANSDVVAAQKKLFLRDNRKIIFDFINKCVRSYAGVVYGGKIGLGWKDYYDTLTGVIGRDLRSTAKPYINHLADDEIAGALTVAWKTSVKDPASFFDGNITDLIRTIIREAA